ncbi:MAG: hypothetical protein AB4372_07185 [Xenococcus sp. (in: cyanobacteria)]
MEELKVVCAADNKYAIPLTVTLYSLLSNLKQGQPIILYVIDSGIKWWKKVKIERSLRKAHNNFKLEWLNSNLYIRNRAEGIGKKYFCKYEIHPN